VKFQNLKCKNEGKRKRKIVKPFHSETARVKGKNDTSLGIQINHEKF